MNAVFLPMLMIAGVFYDEQDAPAVLRDIAEVLPLKHLVDGLSGAIVHGDGVADHAVALLVLALWTAVGLVLAIRGFSWDARRDCDSAGVEHVGRAAPPQPTGGRLAMPNPTRLRRESRIARCGGLAIHARTIAAGVLKDPQPSAIASPTLRPRKPAARARRAQRRAARALVGEVAAARHVARVAGGGAGERRLQRKPRSPTLVRALLTRQPIGHPAGAHPGGRRGAGARLSGGHDLRQRDRGHRWNGRRGRDRERRQRRLGGRGRRSGDQQGRCRAERGARTGRPLRSRIKHRDLPKVVVGQRSSPRVLGR